tara:strand:- start:87 stop:686 length:600 start_codon:yes stop_codon:yes gene_type:complete
MPNYQDAKIYKLINDSMPGLVYYGSTCNTFSKRLGQHKDKQNTCSSKCLFEDGTVQIILVEKYPCTDKMELNARERYYIENNDCVNKSIPGRTRKEYYKDNQEKIVLYSREYKEKNREEVNRKAREFKEKHRDEIRRKDQEYRAKNKVELNKRRRELYQQNKDKFHAKDSKYREKNRDELNRKARERYAKKKAEKLVAQ